MGDFDQDLEHPQRPATTPVTSSRAPAARLDGVYPADAAHVARIRSEVAKVARGCGADERTVARIKLAVGEAVTNAVVHAYRHTRAGGDVHVFIEQADGLLTVCVRDKGIGMSPRIDSPGAGLGLSLIADLADRCEINIVSSGGTEVILGFQFA